MRSQKADHCSKVSPTFSSSVLRTCSQHSIKRLLGKRSLRMKRQLNGPSGVCSGGGNERAKLAPEKGGGYSTAVGSVRPFRPQLEANPRPQVRPNPSDRTTRPTRASGATFVPLQDLATNITTQCDIASNIKAFGSVNFAARLRNKKVPPINAGCLRSDWGGFRAQGLRFQD